jgi:CheY-like chemotaxis protein
LEIVLIEDDDVDVEAVSCSLLRLVDPPHRTVFSTANEALRALQGQQANRPADPFIILLDLNLPGKSGLLSECFPTRLASPPRLR